MYLSSKCLYTKGQATRQVLLEIDNCGGLWEVRHMRNLHFTDVALFGMLIQYFLILFFGLRVSVFALLYIPVMMCYPIMVRGQKDQ